MMRERLTLVSARVVCLRSLGPVVRVRREPIAFWPTYKTCVTVGPFERIYCLAAVEPVSILGDDESQIYRLSILERKGSKSDMPFVWG